MICNLDLFNTDRIGEESTVPPPPTPPSMKERTLTPPPETTPQPQPGHYLSTHIYVDKMKILKIVIVIYNTFSSNVIGISSRTGTGNRA